MPRNGETKHFVIKCRFNFRNVLEMCSIHLPKIFKKKKYFIVLNFLVEQKLYVGEKA